MVKILIDVHTKVWTEITDIIIFRKKITEVPSCYMLLEPTVIDISYDISLETINDHCPQMKLWEGIVFTPVC